MKSIIIIFMLIVGSQLKAIEKDESQKIAKSSQCNYIRSNTFAEVYERYTSEKPNEELVKKASDAILGQGFKICDPENTTNADKEIHAICFGSCEKKATSGILDFGGPNSSEIDKCKRMCQAYTDMIGQIYESSKSAIARYIDSNPLCTKKADTTSNTPAPIADNNLKTLAPVKSDSDTVLAPTKKASEAEETKISEEIVAKPPVEPAIKPEPPKEMVPVELLE